jgi:hypothetical protein
LRRPIIELLRRWPLRTTESRFGAPLKQFCNKIGQKATSYGAVPVGVLAFGANGFVRSTLFGTPFDDHSSAALPVM